MPLNRIKLLYPIETIAIGLLLYAIIFFILRRWSKHKERIIPKLLNAHIFYPGFFFIFFTSAWISLYIYKRRFNSSFFDFANHSLKIIVIASSAILIIKIISFFRDIALHHYKERDPLDYKFRKAKTQFQLIQRVLNFMIMLTTFAIILMTFKGVREVGSTLLASAGVLGLVIGFAAQKSLGTIFAGIQIALSQPIRIDDVVVVEGQYGTIGEINLTYVIVNSWDGRRLTLPINYFLEKPFENWTRDSPEIIAKVIVYLDYTAPIEEIREKFMNWTEESPLWDGRVRNFMLTGTNDKTIELRGIMSARNSGDAFDMQCDLREKIITYVRENYPSALPKTRVSSASEDIKPFTKVSEF